MVSRAGFRLIQPAEMLSIPHQEPPPCNPPGVNLMKTNLVWHAITGLLLSGIATESDLSFGRSLIRLNHGLQAAEPIPSTTSKSWKLDYDILHSATYQGHYSTFSKGHLKVDQDDQLWMPLTILFPGDANTTDAWSPLAKHVTLLSKNRGRTWEITNRAAPTPVANRVTLADHTLLEVSSSGYFRFPRTEIRQLEQKGYQVWDLGPQEDYCAIIYDLIARRSTDGGKTWQERGIHKQLPFFAHFVGRGPLRQLHDGALIYFGYGATPAERVPLKQDPSATTKNRLHRYGQGRWSVYCIRSEDNGETWQAIRAADGRLSPLAHGFSETFPIINSDGQIFVLLRTGLGSHAYSISSADGGRTWTKATQTPIQAKHPLPTRLRDGTIVCSYQRRFAPPFGVRARFTSDYGKTWTEEIVLRDNIPLSDALAEPTTVELADGTLFTAFQGKKLDDQGRPWEFIGGCHWSRDYRRPWSPKLEVPQPSRKFNAPKSAD